MKYISKSNRFNHTKFGGNYYNKKIDREFYFSIFFLSLLLILYIIIEKNTLRLSDTFENAKNKGLLEKYGVYCAFVITLGSHGGVVIPERYAYFNIRKDSIVVSFDEFDNKIWNDTYIGNSNLISENNDADIKYIYDNYKKNKNNVKLFYHKPKVNVNVIVISVFIKK